MTRIKNMIKKMSVGKGIIAVLFLILIVYVIVLLFYIGKVEHEYNQIVSDTAIIDTKSLDEDVTYTFKYKSVTYKDLNSLHKAVLADEVTNAPVILNTYYGDELMYTKNAVVIVSSKYVDSSIEFDDDLTRILMSNK